MKPYITASNWEKLEKILKMAEIPYSVSWDSHMTDGMEEVIYDKYIRIEPIVIQSKESAEDCV